MPGCTEMLLTVKVAQKDASAEDGSLARCCHLSNASMQSMPPKNTASLQDSPMTASLLPVVALLSSDARMPLPRVAMYPA